MSFVRFVARFLLVAIFLLSGFSKLNDIVKANGDVTATKGFSYAVQGLNGLPKEISSQIPPDAYQVNHPMCSFFCFFLFFIFSKKNK